MRPWPPAIEVMCATIASRDHGLAQLLARVTVGAAATSCYRGLAQPHAQLLPPAASPDRGRDHCLVRQWARLLPRVTTGMTAGAAGASYHCGRGRCLAPPWARTVPRTTASAVGASHHRRRGRCLTPPRARARPHRGCDCGCDHCLMRPWM